MNPVHDLLVKGQALINNPNRWTQGASARDQHGESANVWGDRATCFCSYGALSRANKGGNDHHFYQASKILDEVAGGSIVEFNDTHTHAEVMEVWEKARVQSLTFS